MWEHAKKSPQQKREATRQIFGMLHLLFCEGGIASHISSTSTGIYLTLFDRANYFGAGFNDYFYCSDESLAKSTGLCIKTISDGIDKLMGIKLVYCIRGKCKGTASYYYLPYPYNTKREDNPMDKLRKREENKEKALKYLRELQLQEDKEIQTPKKKEMIQPEQMKKLISDLANRKKM